jgi:hypothetical protein
LRLNGVASITENDPLIPTYLEAEFVIRVRATEVFPNCPRYIHKMQLVKPSRFVPRAACETPEPGWKQANGLATRYPSAIRSADKSARLAATMIQRTPRPRGAQLFIVILLGLPPAACRKEPTAPKTVDLIPNLTGKETTELSFAQCAASVDLWTIAGGGHMSVNAPGVVKAAVEQLLGR